MQQERYLTVLIRLLQRTALIDLGLFIVVGLLVLIGGWPTLYDYGTALTWVGVILIVVAFLIGMGGAVAAHEELRSYTRTGTGDVGKHIRRIFGELDNRFVLLSPMVMAGIVSLLAGYVLQSVAVSPQ